MRESEDIIITGPLGLKIFECSDNPDRQVPIKSINPFIAAWRQATIRFAQGKRKTHPGGTHVFPACLTYPPADDSEFAHYAPNGSDHYFRFPTQLRWVLPVPSIPDNNPPT